MGEERKVYKVLVGKPEGKRPLLKPRRRWEDMIRMDLRETGPYPKPTLSTPQPISSRSIMIPSSHLCLILPNGLDAAAKINPTSTGDRSPVVNPTAVKFILESAPTHFCTRVLF
jgi:hypothetical protein